jgi:hypothetical protein
MHANGTPSGSPRAQEEFMRSFHVPFGWVPVFVAAVGILAPGGTRASAQTSAAAGAPLHQATFQIRNEVKIKVLERASRMIRPP